MALGHQTPVALTQHRVPHVIPYPLTGRLADCRETAPHSPLDSPEFSRMFLQHFKQKSQLGKMQLYTYSPGRIQFVGYLSLTSKVNKD